MSHRYIKITVTAAVLAAAFGFMLWTTLRDGAEYFKHVDEVVAQRTELGDKNLQMHGYVIPNSIANKPNTLQYYFRVQNNPIRAAEPGHIMEVNFTGVPPDTFKGEAEVVVGGHLTKDGKFESTKLTAKCPSKYEAAGGAPAGS